MSLQAPEREILNFQPHLFKTIAFVSAALFLTRIIFDWKFLIEGHFSKIEFVPLVIALLVFIITSSTRIILSTHSIKQKIGPFFRYETQRSQVEAIKITPTAQYMQKKAHPILFKKLFSKKDQEFTAEYWNRHGVLHFIHSEKIYTLFKMSLTDILLSQLSEEQSTQLIRHLVQDWQLAKPLVEEEFPAQPLVIAQNDIGKYALVLLVVSLLIGLIAFCTPMLILQSLHFGIESYLWMIPCFMFAIGLSFFLIRQEAKSYPFATSILVGLVLGPSLYFLALQINRFYSESVPQKTWTVELKLIEQKERYQTWQLPKELIDKTGLTEIYIAKKWQNTHTHVELNQSYPITIHQGLFQDYWLTPHDFQPKPVTLETQP